jgi:hypothetical protein
VAASAQTGGEAAYMVRVYAFYIPENDLISIKDDTSKWAPSSYEDADAGIIRHIDTGDVRSFGLMGKQSEDTYVHLTVSSSPVVLVAVDPVNKFYAYRAFDYLPPLRDPVRMVLQFRLYETAAEFENSNWTVVNSVLKDQESNES